MKMGIIDILKQKYGIFQIANNGFWFIDIPRTSSTSIKVKLSQKFGFTYAKNGYRHFRDRKFYIKGAFLDHRTAKEMKTILGEKLWDRIFTFSMVRNPWDRTVSAYNYRKLVHPHIKNLTFREYVLGLMKDPKYKRARRPFYLNDCYHYISEDGEIIVDSVLRFENRVEDLTKVAVKIGCEDLFESHWNKTVREKEYVNYYDGETKRIVEELCAKDIEQFNYTFE